MNRPVSLALLLSLTLGRVFAEVPTGTPISGVVPAVTVAPTPPPVPAAVPADSPFAGAGNSLTYSQVRVNGPFIAMTFDDGPHKELTPRLLDLLKARKIHATFFVIGKNANDYPDIMRRIAAEGHEIANHSWSHPILAKLAQDTLIGEITKTTDAITRATNRPVTLLRPPYGALTQPQKEWVRQTYGYRIILWDVDPLDWRRPGSEVVEQRIVSQTKPGSIVLAHDIHKGTVDAMPSTLDQLLARGFQFVTVSELLKMEQPAPPKAPGKTPRPAAIPNGDTPAVDRPIGTPTPLPFDAVLRAEPVLSPEQAAKLAKPTPTPTPTPKPGQKTPKKP